MKNLEIEKKYLIKKEKLPKDFKKYEMHKIEQGFLMLRPCLRIRKQDKKYYFTIKTIAPTEFKKFKDLVRTEIEFEITEKTYNMLLKKCVGRIIVKDRYLIPYKNKTIELDVFRKDFKGLIYAEVEFKNMKEVNNFSPPDWFYKDVTNIEKYKNTNLSVLKDLNKVLYY